MPKDELVGCCLAVLEVHPQLREREVSVGRGCSNGARCASFSCHPDVDGISYEVSHRLIPDLGVEDVGGAEFAVLTARERNMSGRE
jgi:hypothetical protein